MNFLPRLGANDFSSKQMAQSFKDLLHSLKENQSKLDALAVMFPDGIKLLSEELKDVVSAITASEAEIHEINIGVKTLQLETQCKRAKYTVLGS